MISSLVNVVCQRVWPCVEWEMARGRQKVNGKAAGQCDGSDIGHIKELSNARDAMYVRQIKYRHEQGGA
jgi:hypothetical protein